jgi:protein CpxP
MKAGIRTHGLFAAGLMAATIGLSAYAAEAPAPRGDNAEARPAGMHMQREMDGLKQQLGLDKKQEALFQSAREASQQAMREGMQSRREHRDRLKQALNGPNPDLRALAGQMDKEREEHMKKHRQVRDAWLNFYDALDPAQKDKARQFILARFGHMEDMGRKMRHGMRQERGAGAPPPGSGPR